MYGNLGNLFPSLIAYTEPKTSCSWTYSSVYTSSSCSSVGIDRKKHNERTNAGDTQSPGPSCAEQKQLGCRWPNKKERTWRPLSQRRANLFSFLFLDIKWWLLSSASIDICLQLAFRQKQLQGLGRQLCDLYGPSDVPALWTSTQETAQSLLKVPISIKLFLPDKTDAETSNQVCHQHAATLEMSLPLVQVPLLVIHLRANCKIAVREKKNRFLWNFSCENKRKRDETCFRNEHICLWLLGSNAGLKQTKVFNFACVPRPRKTKEFISVEAVCLYAQVVSHVIMRGCYRSMMARCHHNVIARGVGGCHASVMTMPDDNDSVRKFSCRPHRVMFFPSAKLCLPQIFNLLLSVLCRCCLFLLSNGSQPSWRFFHTLGLVPFHIHCGKLSDMGHYSCSCYDSPVASVWAFLSQNRRKICATLIPSYIIIDFTMAN